jgi:hypothetical protein
MLFQSTPFRDRCRKPNLQLKEGLAFEILSFGRFVVIFHSRISIYLVSVHIAHHNATNMIAPSGYGLQNARRRACSSDQAMQPRGKGDHRIEFLPAIFILWFNNGINP